MTEEVDKKTRSRGWIIVIHSYDEDAEIAIANMYEMDDNASYLIVGYELASRTKAPHLQCYIYYTNAISWSKMRKHIKAQGYNWHFEYQKAKKNVEAYSYCMKDGQYVEFGERPRQGNRTDLEVIKHDIEAGRPDKEIAQKYFAQWCQYGRRFEMYRELRREKYATKVAVYEKEKAISHMRKIRTEYKDYHIVTQYIDWLEIANIVASGKFSVVFVPNIGAYSDYSSEIDFTLIDHANQENNIDID